MKLFRITLVFILAISQTSFSQEDNTGSNQLLMEGSGTMLMTTGKRALKTKGTPYLKEKFEAANVIGFDNKIYNIRYNAFTDEIEIKLEDGSLKKMNNSLENVVVKTTLSKTIFEPLEYVDEDGNKLKGFLISLTPNNDSVKLYLRKSKRFVEAKPAQTGYDKDKPAEYKDERDEYYIKYNDSQPVFVPKKKKDFLKLFPAKKGEIESFIKKNKIKTNREDDLIALTNYMNSL
ncbi:MAG: hypothetical protein AAF688_12315 [Bacteroidota bacterium]